VQRDHNVATRVRRPPIDLVQTARRLEGKQRLWHRQKNMFTNAYVV